MLIKKIARKIIYSIPWLKPTSWRDRFEVGRGTYGEPKVLHWGESAKLTVGAYCSIADGCMIFLGGNHRTDWITTYPFSVLSKSAKHIEGHPATRGDVIIGNDVWIGVNSTILSGVKIGNGAVIGACAVVTKNVPAYAIVAGNPAKVIRERFSPDEVSELEKIAWWDWSEEKINSMMPLLLSSDVSKLVAFSRKKAVLLG